MIKAMLFVDGGWLYAHTAELGKSSGKADFQIDFGRLPHVLVDELARQSGIGRIDVVRSYYFGSYADNYDPVDEPSVQRRKAFFARLKEEHGFDLETFAIDYQGRRLRRQDRDPNDSFAPREKCVDVALAVTLMRFASMPGAMDLAILVLGDRDFVPLLHEVRRLGKRVAIVSIDGCCAEELVDPADGTRVRDFDVLWLDDLLNKIDRWQARTRTPRLDEQDFEELVPEGRMLQGRIKNIIGDRGYGFIAAEDGDDYFFHANALEPGLEFDTLDVDRAVIFEVRSNPTPGRAGAARLVRRDPAAIEQQPPYDDDDEEDEAAAERSPQDDESRAEPQDQPYAGRFGNGDKRTPLSIAASQRRDHG